MQFDVTFLFDGLN